MPRPDPALRECSDPVGWIVTDALIESRDAGLALHPALEAWRGALLRRVRRWHAMPPRTPLEWAAALAERSPAGCVADAMGGAPEGAAQCWVATPYHAMLGRDSVRVMPEGLFPWDAADAARLAESLAPVLVPRGFELRTFGAAMIACCRPPLEADPCSFAAVGGSVLPDRHPPGADGGALMRLMAEIQMHLHQRPLLGREGRPPVTGVWLWGAWSPEESGGRVERMRVMTRNPALGALCEARSAPVLISEADRLEQMLRPEAQPPEFVVLAGAGRAVLLRKSWRAWRAAPLHPPASPQAAEALDRALRSRIGSIRA